eukprot:gnl/MRDRNA2_/MRDRNA2_332011_c0_seq1.p1 gnl/MRDRNA2_/MRDRNA2_332011_c0~~gnl/MRDRNA2_/MRDRNA2_332011_c0_seq1.p1  ORF type:complete len:166 (-),score=7.11 gnl/MRDRNA2_/MRDRNA2_332011_c0_seq1:2-499(-)
MSHCVTWNAPHTKRSSSPLLDSSFLQNEKWMEIYSADIVSGVWQSASGRLTLGIMEHDYLPVIIFPGRRIRDDLKPRGHLIVETSEGKDTKCCHAIWKLFSEDAELLITFVFSIESSHFIKLKMYAKYELTGIALMRVSTDPYDTLVNNENPGPSTSTSPPAPVY